MKEKLLNVKTLIIENRKVMENYFFMTILQILSSLFYFLIYPFLIRTLGAESYGLYIFATSVVTYFITFIGNGFDFPGVKAIATNGNDLEKKSHVLSCIFTAKMYLQFVSTIVFTLIILTIPALRENYVIYVICFLQTLSGIFFPQWYFQGVQRMKIVTYIQLLFKILSLPFIFIMIHSPKDLWIFALITTLVSLLGAITAALIVRFNEGIKLNWVSFKEVKIWYKEAFPFFLSSSLGIVKEQSITIIIGSFFGMRDVAIYDLANKIILIPRTLLVNVNLALFPKIVANVKPQQIKKIIRYEALVGLSVIALIAIFGRWIVLIMGGETMLDSYPVSVILSVVVLVWLVVGAFISFVFIPQNKYKYVTNNQIIALSSFALYSLIGFLITKSIYVLVLSIALSGLTEIAYCWYLTKREKLL
ncbi:oligosaccharide flippase family protein [Flavobacterium sp. TR2]|uniref:oligosaccharide flippase family protein n=1 Tax=Flavobacterium sp. TR2 TaxID=2977321 RepID=UPI0021B1159C|nr:oligosaccharide flippase family protein [Flavobacterium sp. TR2]UWY28637.1 oligosaccharide flippase family protein [Flavobacterium sp. TR2]